MLHKHDGRGLAGSHKRTSEESSPDFELLTVPAFSKAHISVPKPLVLQGKATKQVLPVSSLRKHQYSAHTCLELTLPEYPGTAI
jgi:hypothetical protein